MHAKSSDPHASGLASIAVKQSAYSDGTRRTPEPVVAACRHRQTASRDALRTGRLGRDRQGENTRYGRVSTGNAFDHPSTEPIDPLPLLAPWTFPRRTRASVQVDVAAVDRC